MFQVFMISLECLQPSQPWVVDEQLEGCLRGWQTSTLNWLHPLVVQPLGGGLVLIDGHARALAAHRLGIKRIRARWDDGGPHVEHYRTCVNWCQQVGVFAIADLDQRVVDAKAYETEWLERCRGLSFVPVETSC